MLWYTSPLSSRDQPLGFAKVTLVKLLQPSNASAAILVTFLPIVTLAKLLQSWNAHISMPVTLSGIVTLVKLLQPLNAE